MVSGGGGPLKIKSKNGALVKKKKTVDNHWFI